MIDGSIDSENSVVPLYDKKDESDRSGNQFTFIDPRGKMSNFSSQSDAKHIGLRSVSKEKDWSTKEWLKHSTALRTGDRKHKCTMDEHETEECVVRTWSFFVTDEMARGYFFLCEFEVFSSMAGRRSVRDPPFRWNEHHRTNTDRIDLKQSSSRTNLTLKK